MEKNRNLGRRENTQSTSGLVSLFSGYTNSKPIGKIELSEFLLSSTYKRQVEEIRSCHDKAKRRDLKSKLPAVTPSGIFSKRSNSGLIKRSGFICIDIDGDQNPAIGDWEALKWSISDLTGLWYAGLSASGKGLFLLFKVKYPEKHIEHFNAIGRKLKGRRVEIDQSCKDIARLRGVSYDPKPVYCPDAVPFEGLLTENAYCVISNGCMPEMHESYIRDEIKPNVGNADLTAYRVGKLIERIDVTGANIAEYYPDWYAIGRALASEFGESGRDWFHIVSSKSLKYRQEECDRQYDHCLRTCARTSIRTFFYYCKLNGITANRLTQTG